MAANSFELAQQFSQTHPQEAAQVLGKLPRPAGTAFLLNLPGPVTGNLLNAMLPPAAAAHLSEMPVDEAVVLLRELPPQRAANVIRFLSSNLRRRALKEENAVRRSQIQFYLRQVRGTVGAWVEVDVVVATPDESVDSIRNKLAVYQGTVPSIFVIDSAHKNRGAVSAMSVIAADPAAPVSQIMKPPGAVLRARTPIEIAVTDEAWRRNDILAVVGPDERFIGVVRYATLRHAVDDLAGAIPLERTESGLLGLTDAWFLGLSDIISVSVVRPDRWRENAAPESETSP